MVWDEIVKIMGWLWRSEEGSGLDISNCKLSIYIWTRTKATLVDEIS